MKVWIKIYQKDGKTTYTLRVKEPKDEGWQEYEIEDLEDIKVTPEGQVIIKTPDEKLQEKKQERLKMLKTNYKSLIVETDERVLQYQKRKALGRLTEDDEQDYQEALQKYNEITDWYFETKKAILNAQSLEELYAIKIEG